MGFLTWSSQLLFLQLFLFYSHTSAALCSRDESSALLQFKQLFSFKNISCLFYGDFDVYEVPSYPKMISWKEEHDCCSWDGVTCDLVTGHVIGLDLSCSWLSGKIPSNITLSLLPQLKRLNLAFNDFNLSQIYSDFGRLTSLTHLNLSASNFSGPIPFEISHLSTLVSLDLSWNYNYPNNKNNSLRIERPVFESLVQNLTILTNLTLDDVDMSTIIPTSLTNLSSSLTSLSLSWCQLQGDVPERIFRLPNLKTLQLNGNFNLTGNFPKVNWSSPLELLEVSDMSLSEQLPNSIGNLFSLRILYLYNCPLIGSVPASLGNLTQLASLSLSWCELQGDVPERIFRLPNLKTLQLNGNFNLTGNFPKVNWSSPLENLDVSDMSFSEQLPNSISNLFSLRELNLDNCTLVGSVPASLGNLTRLISLSMSNNKFSGHIPSFLSNLVNLRFLVLSNNNFIGQFLAFFVNFTQLSYLSLSNNQLTSPIPSRVNVLPNLVEISLSSNNLNGTIPSWLFNLPLLELLDLSDNQLIGHIDEFQINSLRVIFLDDNRLNGSIPSSIFEHVNLTTLGLSSNSLSGIVELHLFSKLKNLNYLDLSLNSLSINIAFKVNSSFPQLRSLRLSGCNLSEFPGILRSVNQLQYLDLSDNKISGQIPNWMWDVGKDTLSFLNLSHNYLTRIEHLPWKNLNVLDLNSNKLQGSLPIPPHFMTVLLLSNNKFIGEIPHLICKMSAIEILDLSNNSFSGNIPICMGNFSNLHVLDLRKNKLYGIIPGKFAKGSPLRTLNFNENELEGPIPRSLVDCTKLQVLDIGNNKLNDTFPYWLESLPELQVLVLHSNQFYGSVPGCSKKKHCFPKLKVFDLSNNKFGGPLPAWYFENLQAMKDVSEAERELEYMGESYYQDSITVTMKGYEFVLVKIITAFTAIDFSNNNFCGEIPKAIGELHSLLYLNLSLNKLTGCIPPSLGNLNALESLDLSSNKLVGKIPSQLANLDFLEALDLSHNQLTGPIPRAPHFDTFENTSYAGNLGLCGFPLSKECRSNETLQPPSKLEDDVESSFGFGWKVVLIGYGCGMVFGLIMGYLVFSTGKPQWVVRIVEGEHRRKGRRPNKKRGGRRG